MNSVYYRALETLVNGVNSMFVLSPEDLKTNLLTVYSQLGWQTAVDLELSITYQIGRNHCTTHSSNRYAVRGLPINPPDKLLKLENGTVINKYQMPR